MHTATAAPEALQTVVYEDRLHAPRRKPSPLAVVLFALAVLGLIISITCLILLVVLLADTILVKKTSTTTNTIGKRSVDAEYVHDDHYSEHSIHKRQTATCPAATDEVTFACVDDYKPFCFGGTAGTANAGEILGLMRDAMDCACKQKGKTCRLIKVPARESWNGDTRYSNVLYNSGTGIYAVAGYSLTLERQPVVSLMGELYGIFLASFYKATSNTAIITTVNGLRIGVMKHSSATKDCFGRVVVSQSNSLIEYESTIDLYNALTKNVIDLAFISDDVFQASAWTDVTKTIINSVQCTIGGGGWLISKNVASSNCVQTWFEDGLKSSTCVTQIKQNCTNYKNQGFDPKCSGIFTP